MNLSDSLFAYQKYIKHGKYHDGHQVFHTLVSKFVRIPRELLLAGSLSEETTFTLLGTGWKVIINCDLVARNISSFIADLSK